MTEKNNQAAEIVEKDLVAAASDTESVNDFESAEGRMLITEQEDAKGESAPTSTAADGRDEKTPIIFLDDVHVIFKTRTGSILHPNKVHAVNGLTLKLMPGETIGIVGESGCGKSTTANVMCGLQAPTSGHVYFKGTDVTKRTAAQRRIIGRVISVVFQDPATALNARMSVRDQLTDPMVVHNVGDAKSREARVHELIEMVGLPESVLDALPGQMSGGQRQRVAIGRAIVRDPQVFLMDEPLSNLDAKLRNQMRAEIIKLRQRINTTFIYVTHDQTEAMTLGDRIVIMKDGFIQQIGTPQEVFDQPANLFVAGFIGSPQMNFFDGELEKKDGKYQLKVGEATVVLGGKAQELLTGKGVGERKVTVGIRPEHIAFAAAPGSDTVSSKVDVSEMMGSEVYLHVNAVGRDVVLRIPTTDLPAEHRAGIPYGTEINFAFRPDLIHLFDPETEKNLMY